MAVHVRKLTKAQRELKECLERAAGKGGRMHHDVEPKRYKMVFRGNDEGVTRWAR